MKKQMAFTLAEVLITLTIIGVIAAITIPNLMKNYKNHVTVTKVQKAYNQLSKMAANIKQNSQCDNVDCLYHIETDDRYKQFIDLAQIKDIQTIDKPNVNLKRLMYLYCENQSCDSSKGDTWTQAFKTQDGLMYIRSFTRNTAFNNDYLITVSVITEPNARNYLIGRNVFKFIIYDEWKVEPLVISSDGRNWPMSKNNTSAINAGCSNKNTSVVSGSSCAARILSDGWKIKY